MRRAWRPLAWAGAAAAAALLALLARQLAGPRSGGSAELAGALDAGSAAAHESGQGACTTTNAEREDEEPVLVALDERRLEMRSGSVRLVLLHPSSDGPGTRNP